MHLQTVFTRERLAAIMTGESPASVDVFAMGVEGAGIGECLCACVALHLLSLVNGENVSL